MSDPVSNAEVEDVLSSIRRLVSEEKRSPAAVEKPDASDRLVLTPALRVAEHIRPALQEAHVEHAPEVEPDHAENPAPVEDETLETAQFHEVTDADDDNDTSDDAHADDALDASESDVEHDDAQPEDVAEHVQEDLGEQDTPDVLVLVPDSVESAPDMPDELMSENTPEAENISEFVAEETFEDIPVAEPVDAMQEISSAATLSAKIAALETVIGRTDDQWEPDDTGDSDYSGTEAPSMTWEDTSTVQDAADAAIDSDVFASPEDFLDEDALRDLVSDIVREELQGALGERITRNVRKLVRREIHRALAAQELE